MTKYIIATLLSLSAITCVDYIQPKKSSAQYVEVHCWWRNYCGNPNTQPAYQFCAYPIVRLYCEERVNGSIFYQWSWK